jgi:hypothetical protein
LEGERPSDEKEGFDAFEGLVGVYEEEVVGSSSEDEAVVAAAAVVIVFEYYDSIQF